MIIEHLPDTVTLDTENRALVIIDQTKLPGELVMLSLHTQEEIREAICTLRVRGAPAIGVAAAYGMYLAALEYHQLSRAAFDLSYASASASLASSRPTAVNLFYALDRMQRVLTDHKDISVSDLLPLLYAEAQAIRDEEVAASRAIGEYGLMLLHDGDGILTHCNAGHLATVRYGTALAPLHIGREKGMHFHVFADETRPLLQGARLTAFELAADHIDTTVICDNMVSQVMKNGWIQAVIVGADRIAANGDACNKIGTSGVAILARHYGIPFYVAAPFSTVDVKCSTGEEIPIEQRDAEEIQKMWYRQPMTPENVSHYNPAFDCTPHELITAIITERGILRAPYDTAIRKILGQEE